MSLKRLLRRLPSPLYRLLQRLHRRIVPAPQLPLPANPGPLITRIAPQIAAIPGWFNLDDLAHFTLVLDTQSAAGLRGDLLEIGCYHGRSAAVLAMHLRDGEHLVLVDAFDLPLAEPYGDTPTPERVRRNLAAAVPGLDPERVTIHRADSRDLVLPETLRVRFAHVDGGHDAETVRSDLETCATRLIPGGVIAVDDFAHPGWPGVTEAVRPFLSDHPAFRILADLNRTGALGRKLYLTREQ
jgi:SAM-dependent methyltransferase